MCSPSAVYSKVDGEIPMLATACVHHQRPSETPRADYVSPADAIAAYQHIYVLIRESFTTPQPFRKNNTHTFGDTPNLTNTQHRISLWFVDRCKQRRDICLSFI